jgi:hypothetical protein
MALQPTSVRKFSHEEAENRKAAHEASGGNKSQASEQPDPEDEEAVQVAEYAPDRQHAACGDLFGFARQPGAHLAASDGPSDQQSKPLVFVHIKWHQRG